MIVVPVSALTCLMCECLNDPIIKNFNEVTVKMS